MKLAEKKKNHLILMQTGILKWFSPQSFQNMPCLPVHFLLTMQALARMLWKCLPKLFRWGKRRRLFLCSAHPSSFFSCIRQQARLLPCHPLIVARHARCPNFSCLKCTWQSFEVKTDGQDVAKTSRYKSSGVMELWWFTQAVPMAHFASSEVQHNLHDHKIINNKNKCYAHILTWIIAFCLSPFLSKSH